MRSLVLQPAPFAVFSVLLLKKKGHVHPVLSLLPADLAGGYTVCSAVTVSTFLFDYVLGKGRFYALAEPIFWVCVIILAATAIFQALRVAAPPVGLTYPSSARNTPRTGELSEQGACSV